MTTFLVWSGLYLGADWNGVAPGRTGRPRPDRRSSVGAPIRERFDDVVAEIAKSSGVEHWTVKASIRKAVGIALRCGRVPDLDEIRLAYLRPLQ